MTPAARTSISTPSFTGEEIKREKNRMGVRDKGPRMRKTRYHKRFDEIVGGKERGLRR